MSDKLKVMSWNIEEGHALDGVAEAIRANSPDIVLLNEVLQRNYLWDPDQTAYLSEKTGLKYYKFGDAVRMGPPLFNKWWKGMSVLSRFPIGTETIYRKMAGTTENGMLQVPINIDGIWHQVFSIRFTAHFLDLNIAAHRQAIAILRQIPPIQPIIFGGDFNTHPTSSQMIEFVASSGLKDVYSESSDPDYIGGTPDERVDYIFFRGPYTVTKMRQHRDWPDPPDPGYLSDHAWVFVELSRTAEPSTFGTITGRVTDRRKGTGINDAVVTVEGTSIADVTDSSGNYTCSNVPTGTYGITADAEGYYGKTTGGVKVVKDTVTTQDFQLDKKQKQPCQVGKPGVCYSGRPQDETLEPQTIACPSGRPSIAPRPEVKPR